MPAVASGIIAIWDGANSAVPANWSRTTALDGRYPRGAAAGVAPGGTGGSSTHTHTDPGHVHSSGGHTHGLGTLSSASPTIGLVSGSTATAALPGGHAHSGGSTLSATFTLPGTAVWSGISTDPSNYTVIWLQSGGTPTGFAANQSVYWYQPALPAGWAQLGAASGAFAKGAATSGDGGALTIAAPHTHTDSTHTHSASHSHGAAPSGSAGGSASYGSLAGTITAAGLGHSHTITVSSTSITSTAASASTSGPSLVEPPFATLTLIKNGTGAASFPAYAICLWLGALGSIPAGWQLCDGTNGTPDMRTQFAKCSTNLTDIGTTGGALGHSHTAPTVTHTHDVSHSHTFSTGSESNGLTSLDTTTGSLIDSTGHAHANSGADTVPLTSDAQISGVNAITDSRPPYTDVAYVMYTAAPQVTITAPAASAVEALPTFTVSWAYDVLRTQVLYRLFVYDSTGTIVVYDSLPQRSGARLAVVPAGYLQDNTTYNLQVVTSDSGNQTATSPQVQISTSWTAPPTPGGLSATKLGGV